MGGGGLVAYTLDDDLMLAEVGRGEPVRLTFDSGPERDPAFSPDGRSLVFSARRNANWDLYRLDLTDGSVTRLTEHPGYDGHPAWSPDGRTIAFETMRDRDLDIYLIPAEGGEVTPLVASPLAETAPAWSPDGRWLIYSVHVESQRDLWAIPVEGGAPVNLTNTPDRSEDEPALSPDGQALAYSVGPGGERNLYVAPLNLSAGQVMTRSTRLVGLGSGPAWSPDRASIAYTVISRRSAQIQISQARGYNWTVLPWEADLLSGRAAWADGPMPQAVVERAQAAPPAPDEAPLYVEVVATPPASGPPYSFMYVPVRTGGPYLSDRVDDSFHALRERVIAETGFDYLSVFGDLWRRIDAGARPGQSTRSWHKAGRAMDINQGPYGPGQDVVYTLETVGGRTMWRVYFRTARQDGSQGEPLRIAPWSWWPEPSGDTSAGGTLSHLIPPGYWLDYTALAAEYGWQRVPALRRWRTVWVDTDWWHFQKTDGLDWEEAMREVYAEEEIEEAFGLR
jgi:TolB protein